MATNKEKDYDGYTIKQVVERFEKGANERFDKLEGKIDQIKDTLLPTKVDKPECDKNHVDTNRLVWGLFGFNILGFVGIVVTLISIFMRIKP